MEEVRLNFQLQKCVRTTEVAGDGTFIAPHTAMANERRQHFRKYVSLECLWDGRPARLSDVSRGGCYVDSRFVPPLGSVTEVIVMLNTQPIVLRGTVVHSQHGVGFALRFDIIDGTVRDFLRATLGDQ
jgi:hypothetical protein